MIKSRTSLNEGRRRFVAGLCGATAGVFVSARAATPPAGKVKVLATTGMVGDLVRQVGGDRVELDVLMGPGVDPHLFKPTATDLSRLSRAGVIFYSGLMLEGRMGDVFEKMTRSGRRVFPITRSVSEKDLLSPKAFEGHHDPHVWFDVALWSACVPEVVRGLTAADPGGRADFERNGKATRERLEELHRWAKARTAEIPEARRIVCTSHDAFNYFGRAYGFKVVGVQGVSTVAEASLSDVSRMVDFIKAQKIPAIFVESSVAPTLIQRIARDAGVKIGGELFSDALGSPGEKRRGFDTGTYEGMFRYNLETIVEALK